MLISILPPALGRARECGQSCKCLCQMRSLGQITAMYADASRDLMPRSQHSAFANRAAPWGYAFFEYVTGSAYAAGDPSWVRVYNGVYRCPLDDRRDRWSYGYNVYFELAPDETGGRTWTHLSQVPRPSATVLFGELSNLTSADHAMAHTWTTMSAPPEIDAERHGGKTGVVFADGHAENRAFDTLFSVATDCDSFNPETAR